MQLLELASIPGLTEQEQRDLLHIVIVGGGPTGVEIAAEMSDLFNEDFSKLYPDLNGKMTVTIHDAAEFILGAFEDSLRQHAISSFSKRHVNVVTGSKIKEVRADSITTEAEGRVGCGMVLWTAGNKQCALVDSLDVAKTDKLPRILTDDFLHALSPDKEPMQDVFALGDAADIKKHFLPTTAEVAVQKAEYLAKVLNNDDTTTPFEYKQKGLVAYIVSLMDTIPIAEIPRGFCLRHLLIYPFIFAGRSRWSRAGKARVVGRKGLGGLEVEELAVDEEL